ncbi:MAG TPA: sugar ABC transporter substrate-binding protein [Thermomicrobiales bacterium]|nr:sugar ABC transporter substrate-binding protein [Thermomicrobiales bacterium]
MAVDLWTPVPPTGRPISRRGVIKGGAAVAASSMAMPYFFSRRSSARQNGPLRFMQFYSEGDVASQADWFENCVQAWNDANEVQVELEYVPTAEYVSGTQLATAFASGQGPDIFLVSPGDFLRYSNGGALFDLTDYIQADAQADFLPDVIANRMVNDRIFAVPMEVEPMAMYYSRSAWDDAGLTDADIPTTWEQLLGVAGELANDERFGVMFETTPGYYQNFTWYPFMWQGGGELQDASGASAFNSEATIQALTFWQTSIRNGVAPRDILGSGGADIVPNLVDGYTAMQNVGIWGISALEQNAPDFEYGVFKLPLPPGGTDRTVLGGWAFAANAAGQNPEIAAQFIASSIGAMTEESINRVVDWCTVAKSDMPPRQSVLDRATQNGAYSSGAMQVFAEQILPSGRAEPRVPPEIYQAVSDAIQATQLNDADPAQAAAAASEQINAFLATYTGAPIL